MTEMTEIERKALKEALFYKDRVCYAYAIGFEPFAWQKAFLRDPASWKLLLCGRQSGKSTIISLATCHKAKYRPGTLSVVLAPNKGQSQDDMLKIKNFIRMDPEFPAIKKNNDDEIVFANGSRIQVVTATDTGARGKSAPALVIFDEAALIPDAVLGAALPMVTNSAPGYEVVFLSTPHGQDGGFYRACSDTVGEEERYGWHRYFVTSPWIPGDDGMSLIRDQRTDSDLMQEWQAKGWVGGWYSPTHENRALHTKILSQNGESWYRQEYRCEFVAADDDVFDPSDIDSMFSLPEGVDMGTSFAGDDDDFIFSGEAV